MIRKRNLQSGRNSSEHKCLFVGSRQLPSKQHGQPHSRPSVLALLSLSKDAPPTVRSPPVNPDEGSANNGAHLRIQKRSRPSFKEMLNSNADPADDTLLIPVIHNDTDMTAITDEDFHDIFAEYEILRGIVDRAKARAKEAPDASAKENPKSNPPPCVEPAPVSSPKRGLLQRVSRPKIPLPKLPGPVVKAVEKVKNLYKGSFLAHGISKSKRWVRETAGHVVRWGEEKDTTY